MTNDHELTLFYVMCYSFKVDGAVSGQSTEEKRGNFIGKGE